MGLLEPLILATASADMFFESDSCLFGCGLDLHRLLCFKGRVVQYRE